MGVNVTHATGVDHKVCKRKTELAVIEGVKSELLRAERVARFSSAN